MAITAYRDLTTKNLVLIGDSSSTSVTFDITKGPFFMSYLECENLVSGDPFYFIDYGAIHNPGDLTISTEAVDVTHVTFTFNKGFVAVELILAPNYKSL